MTSKPLSIVAGATATWLQGTPSSASTQPLSSLWSSSPQKYTVLCFLRRLGCQLCRVLAQDMEKLRGEPGASGTTNVICLSYEGFGEGSDVDKSFGSGAYFKGDMWRVDKAEVYSQLFKSKGLLQGYGLGSLITDKSGKVAESKARGVTGNFTGDGMQMAGIFVVARSGEVILDHRQKFFGDDPSNEDILDAIAEAEAKVGGGGGGCVEPHLGTVRGIPDLPPHAFVGDAGELVGQR